MIRAFRKITALRSPGRFAGSGVRVALLGNIANNAFNMTNILRRQGIFAQLIDDGTNTFAFSRPAWEESDVALSYPEVMQTQRTLADWRKLEGRWGWQNGGRVIDPLRRGWPEMLDRLARLWQGMGQTVGNALRGVPGIVTDAAAPHPGTPRRAFPTGDRRLSSTFLDSAIARSGLDGSCAEYLRDAVSQYGRTIETLRNYDVVIAFGFLAAACAYLAERPALYFTYGGDCRVELADRDGKRAMLSRVFAHILASDRFAIEGYGCDREIHEILRARGLLDKVACGFLPNINVALFRRPWDRDAARVSLGWPRDKTVFLLASRVDYAWKQSDVFLEAFAQFAADRDDARLAITGWGNDYRDAQQRIARHGLLGKVIFLEECFAKPGLFRRYAAADAIVDQFKLGSMGSVSYEALCMGKPVLTYLAPFNLFGYPSPPPILNARTKPDILEQLDFCVSQPSALERIGEESARWYATVYSSENLVSCVRGIVERGPRKWIATADFRQNALPAAKIPIPGHRATVSILPWPHPYRAGFALANDCEYFSWEDFCVLGRWLTTAESTPLGRGLGLPVSGSFWFFSEDSQDLGFSYFEGDDWRKTSRLAPHLAELLKLGYLDTLHTYGGFDVRGGFRREHAQAALEELDRLGVRLSVWTNHGSALNVQNLGGLWANDYAKGDVPGSSVYHADLLPQAGFRYFWLDAFSTNRFSLGNPQGRDFEDGLAAPDQSPWGDRILCADRLRDGQEILAFRRFRGRRRWAPDPSSLADQISPRNLDHLEASGGAVILYQHLGCFRDAEGRATCGRGRLLPPPAVQQLKDLADRYRAQRIWIAPCAFFLRYLETVGDLRLDAEPTAEGVVLVLSGHRHSLDEKDLAGVSLCLRGPVRCDCVEIADASGGRRACRSYQVRQVAPQQTIISWPQPTWPEFPFTGKEAP